MQTHIIIISSVQVGDGTNFVLVFSGALLEQAESLLKMGLSPSDVIEGYEMALAKALDILPCMFVEVIIAVTLFVHWKIVYVVDDC